MDDLRVLISAMSEMNKSIAGIAEMVSAIYRAMEEPPDNRLAKAIESLAHSNTEILDVLRRVESRIVLLTGE